MRMTAPLIGGATIGFAVALVWYFRPEPDVSLGFDAAEAPAAEEIADIAPPRIADPGPTYPPAPTETPRAATVPIAPPTQDRAPLPGETPVTPMAQMLADRQQNVIVRDNPDAGGFPPGIVEGEREFAAESIDAAWAPRAEAALLAKFAQLPGLKAIDLQVECRSTMCRFVLTQPTGPAAPGSPQVPFEVFRAELGLTPRWMMAVTDRPAAPTGRFIAYLWREGFARRECFKDGHPTPCSDEADLDAAD
jgi:hypothetical protein